MHSFSLKSQSGLALITVLLIFALVSMLAMSMQQRQSMDIAQASVTFTQTQAQLLTLSAEDIAKAGLAFDLQRDLQNSEEWDTASELWNQSFPTELDGAKIFVTIRDLQGLFNLNSLAPSAPNPTAAFTRFEALLNELQLDRDIATNLRNWLTPQNSANYEYENMSPPYRASEIELLHPSELKLVKGVDIESYQKLEPYITALPMATALNINTSLPEILSSWDAKLDFATAEKLILKSHSGQCGKDRNTALYKNAEELLQTPELAELADKSKNPTGNWDKSDFTVKSQYFSVLIRVQLDDRDLISESIIRRNPDSKNGFNGVIYRDYSRTIEDISRLKIVNC